MHKSGTLLTFHRTRLRLACLGATQPSPIVASAFLSKPGPVAVVTFRALSLLPNAVRLRNPFCDIMRIDLSRLITQKEAAEIRGCTPQAINRLVQRGSLKSVEVLGRRLVYRDEVEKFKPSKGGRPKG